MATAILGFGVWVHHMFAVGMSELSMSIFDRTFVITRVLNWLAERLPALFAYVEAGGTVVAQYNTLDGLREGWLAPFQLHLSRDRVTVEEAPVSFDAQELRAEKEKVLSAVRLPKDLAKATAREAEANFIATKSSDLLSKWYGESEQQIARLEAVAALVAVEIVVGEAPRLAEPGTGAPRLQHLVGIHEEVLAHRRHAQRTQGARRLRQVRQRAIEATGLGEHRDRGRTGTRVSDDALRHVLAAAAQRHAELSPARLRLVGGLPGRRRSREPHG